MNTERKNVVRQSFPIPSKLQRPIHKAICNKNLVQSSWVVELKPRCFKQAKKWLMMRIKAQRIRDAGASTTYIENSILIMENSDSGGCETLETPNIFLFPSVLGFITILILSCFSLERFVLQVKVEVVLFNLESLFC